MEEKMIIYIWNFLLPVILIPISIPLILKKIKPNNFYGFRTKKTLSDKDIWYQANYYSGKTMFISGMITLTGLLILLPFKSYLSIWPFNIMGWIVTILPMTVAVILSFVYLKKL